MADLRASCGELSFCFLFLFVLVVRPVSAAKCEKVDDCTCKMDDGTGTVSLWDIDGRKSGPRYQHTFTCSVLILILHMVILIVGSKFPILI